MAEATKVLYLVVLDDAAAVAKGDGNGEASFRYTRPVLQSTLQLMGCKARHAFKVIAIMPLFFYFLYMISIECRFQFVFVGWCF